MTIERKTNGNDVYEVVGGLLLRRFYIGYTVKECKAMFREEVKNQEEGA